MAELTPFDISLNEVQDTLEQCNLPPVTIAVTEHSAFRAELDFDRKRVQFDVRDETRAFHAGCLCDSASQAETHFRQEMEHYLKYRLRTTGDHKAYRAECSMVLPNNSTASVYTSGLHSTRIDAETDLVQQLRLDLKYVLLCLAWRLVRG